MHRRTSPLRRVFQRIGRQLHGGRAVVVAAIVGAAAVIGAPLIAIAASNQPTAIACADGSDLLVHPGGTWNCNTPAPSPSTLTESPAPSGSASASPSPSTSTTTPPSPTPTTTSPSPSPTTTGPASTGCAALPSACGYPDATNTGAKGELTVVNGSVKLSTAGQVYENKDVRGCITVTAPGVTIRNVKVSCNGWYGLAYENGKAGTARLTLQDVTVSCGNTPGSSGIVSRYINATRVAVSGCENGFSVDTEFSIVDSWVHDLYDGGGAHTDGIQIQATTGSGSNIVVRHNTIDLERTDATGNVFADHCQCTNLTVADNLLKGDPAFPVYCPTNGTSTGVAVTGNRFAGHGGWGWSTGCGRAGYVWSGNILDGSGKAISP